MIKKYYPVRIELAYDCEYSVDNGASWTALAANTAVDIPNTDLPADGKVMVRSTSDDATSINRTTMGWTSRKIDDINIRNGKKLTTLSSLFRDQKWNRIRVHNVPAVTTASDALRVTDIKQLDLDAMPACTNIYALLYKAKVKECSSIRPTLTAAVNMADAFRESRILKMGDFITPNDNGTPIYTSGCMRQLFCHSNFELMPYFELYGKGETNANVLGTLGHMGNKYFLYSKALSVNNGASRYNILLGGGYNNLASNYEEYKGFVRSSSKFGGIDAFHQEYYGNLVSYPFAYNTQAESMFSRFIMPMYEYNYFEAEEHPFYGSTQRFKDLMAETVDDEQRNIVEDPEWLPLFKELEIYDGHESLTSGLFSTVNDRVTKIHGGNKYVSKWCDRHDSLMELTEPVTHGLASDSVWYSRDGKYMVQDGADLKLFNADDTALSTIAGVTASFAQLNEDGSVAYVVTGGRVDVNSDVGQSVTQSVTAYNTVDGSQLFTFEVTGSDKEIMGVYTPDRDGAINLLVTTYVSNGAGGMVEDSSTVKSMKEDGSETLETSLSEVANCIMPSFAESAEFVCVNQNVSPARVIRCFAS